MDRTESQKRTIWKAFDSQRWGFLRWGRVQARNAIVQSIKPTLDILREGDIERAIENVVIDDQPMQAFYERLYMNVGGAFGKRTFEELAGKMKQEDTWTDAVRSWIGVSATERITAVDDTTRKLLTSVMKKGVAEGWSIDRVANAMQSEAGGVARATRIARTEVISASNVGSIEGARATGLPLSKVWLSTRDGRTRGNDPDDVYDHVSPDGQEVEMDEYFIISGQEMDFAGDWSRGADVGNLVNCRCTQIYNVNR